MAKKKKNLEEIVNEQLDEIKKLLDIGLKEKAAEKLLSFFTDYPDIGFNFLTSFSSLFKNLSEENLFFLLRIIDHYFKEESIFYSCRINILKNLKENKERNHRTAFELAEIAEKKFPQNSLFIYEKVVLKYELEEYKLSMDYLEYLYNKDKDNTKKYYLRMKSILLKSIGDLNSAIETLNNALDLYPDDIKFVILLAEYYSEKGEYNFAIEKLDKAIKEINGQNEIIDLYMKKIEICSLLGDLDSKLRTVDEALKIESSNIELISIKVYSLAEKKNYEKASDFIDSTISSIGRHLRLLYLKAFILYSTKKYIEALAIIDEALFREPRNVNFLYAKIDTILVSGEIESAEKILNEALDSGLIFSGFFELKSRIYNIRKQYDHALETINKAIEMDEKSLAFLRAKIKILYNMKDYHSANKIIDEFPELGKDPIVLISKAIFFSESEKYKESIEICNNALEYATSKEQKAILYSIISLNYFDLKNYKSSLDFIEKEAELEGNKMHLVRNKIEIHLIKKRFDEAFDLLNDFCSRIKNEEDIYSVCKKIFEHANNVIDSDRETSKKLYFFLENSHYVSNSKYSKIVDLKNMITTNLIAIDLMENGIKSEILSFEKTEIDPLTPRIEEIIETRKEKISYIDRDKYLF